MKRRSNILTIRFPVVCTGTGSGIGHCDKEGGNCNERRATGDVRRVLLPVIDAAAPAVNDIHGAEGPTPQYHGTVTTLRVTVNATADAHAIESGQTSGAHKSAEAEPLPQLESPAVCNSTATVAFRPRVLPPPTERRHETNALSAVFELRVARLVCLAATTDRFTRHRANLPELFCLAFGKTFRRSDSCEFLTVTYPLIVHHTRRYWRRC